MLSASVGALIAASLTSVTALELLLLLHRSPETYWTAEAAAATLGGPEDSVFASLESLRRDGFIEQARETVAFRYAPRTDHGRRSVDALASAYELEPAAVLDAVSAESLRFRSR